MQRMTDERLAEMDELVKYESAGLWDELLQALKADRERIKELEIQAKKCKWCGVPHERGMNTLCPFTIAEARLDAAALLPYKWRPKGNGYFTYYEVALVKCADELKEALEQK